MPLTAGTRIGPYEVVGAIGAGGMGEVYRGLDTKLGREVALKVLPEAVATDPERLARFTREAQVLASLNHPNIGGIYGLEDAGTSHALVLEFVDGPTLADKLSAAGPAALPVDEALGIARQIAEALDAAHERGIVHRDLKPSNIKITPAGVVKILDFGLAKAASSRGGGAGWAGSARGPARDPSESPTMTGGTQAGVILGTAAYMSPEQARGLPLDKRADLWAFGCVLYEMLTGRLAFPGDTISDVLVSVLDREPTWTSLPPGTPVAAARILRRCLEKDPRRRLRDIGDARLDLDDWATGESTPAMVAGPAFAQREILFQRLTDFPGLKEAPAVSPDGKMVAFVVLVGGKRQIFVSLLAGGAQLQLTRDDVDHEHPRWTPDSSSLIFYRPAVKRHEQGSLWDISALGGWPRRIASSVGGGDISHSGKRIALFQAAGDQLALVTMARDGSAIQRVALLPGGSTYSRPRWSPDDREIAFERGSNTAFDIALDVVPATGGVREQIAQSQYVQGFCWQPDGSGFVYSSSRGSTIYYPPLFNLRAIDRATRADRPLTFGNVSYVEPDMGLTGKLLVNRERSRSDVWKFPIDGTPLENVERALRVTNQTGHVRTPSLNPTGTEIAYVSDTGGHGNLWVAKTSGSPGRQITFEADPAVTIGVPKWSPRGDAIVFVYSRSGKTSLWAVQPDGSDLREVVADAWAPSWSCDGSWLLYQSLAENARRLEKVPIDGGAPVLVLDEAEASLPTESVDGTLYYLSTSRSEAMGLWGHGVDWEFRRVRAEGGFDALARLPVERIPGLPPVATYALSPDGRWLAIAILDGATTNLWALSLANGTMRQLTDFGSRPILMTRSIVWSADSGFVYAAVQESEPDIVLIDGLL